MTACTILYASFYGSTKEYADELAKRLGTTAEPIPDASFIGKLPTPLFGARTQRL